MSDPEPRAGEGATARAVTLAREDRLRQVRAMPSMTNEQTHLCGCTTFFDTDLWRSRIVDACNDHEEARREQRFI